MPAVNGTALRLICYLGPLAALVLLFALPVRAQPPQSAAATPVTCQKPDETLIKFRGGYVSRLDPPDSVKIKRYNAQGAAFNDCINLQVDGHNREMKRLYDEGNTAIGTIADIANRQTADIVEKVKAAIAGRPAAEHAAVAGLQFADADCVAPDKALLNRMPGKKGASENIARTAQYDAQQQAYRACVKTYIGQATAEMRGITDDANARIKEIADRANARITELHNQVQDVIRISNTAAAEEADIVHAARVELPPENTFLDGVEYVTVEGRKPLALADTPKGDGDPNTIVCRKPQQLPDSRLMGPEICKRNGVWAALTRAGQDISSDGQNVVPSEKTRTTDHAAMSCTKVTTGGGYSGYMTNEYCN